MVSFDRGAPRVPASVAVENVGYVGLLNLSAGEMDPYGALVTFDHGTSGERLPTITRNQIP